MAHDFESCLPAEREVARSLLAFAAGVVPPPAADCTGGDEPDDFDRNVAVLAAYMAPLALSLPMLARVAHGLEPCADVSWGELAEELRQDHRGLSDLHFAGVVATTVEAIRHLALAMPAGTYVDSSARLKLFAMGLDVVPEHREAIRALLIHDIDALLGDNCRLTGGLRILCHRRQGVGRILPSRGLVSRVSWSIATIEGPTERGA